MEFLIYFFSEIMPYVGLLVGGISLVVALVMTVLDGFKLLKRKDPK